MQVKGYSKAELNRKLLLIDAELRFNRNLDNREDVQDKFNRYKKLYRILYKKRWEAMDSKRLKQWLDARVMYEKR